MKKLNIKGFSLVELLITIAVISFLMAIATYIYEDARMKSRDAKRMADIDGIHKAINLYMNEAGAAPANAVAGTGECLVSTANTAGGRLIAGNAIYTISTDPKWPATAPASVTDGEPQTVNGGMCYYYFKTATGANFKLSYYTEKDHQIHIITNND